MVLREGKMNMHLTLLKTAIDFVETLTKAEFPECEFSRLDSDTD